MEWDTIIKVFQGLLTPIIGVAVVYVAWQQYKTNRNKFRLVLYDRKLKVFEGLTTLLQHIVRQNTATGEQVQQYKMATIEAIFLFDEDIVNYLNEVKSKVHKLQTVNKITETNSTKDKDSPPKVIEEQLDLLDWFNKQLTKSVDKFKKALRYE